METTIFQQVIFGTLMFTFGLQVGYLLHDWWNDRKMRKMMERITAAHDPVLEAPVPSPIQLKKKK